MLRFFTVFGCREREQKVGAAGKTGARPCLVDALAVLDREVRGRVPGESGKLTTEPGTALESSDKAAAEAAYRRALERDPGYANAFINLGALLCEAERCGEAVVLYDEAIRRCPDHALLYFNRAIALEDQGRLSDALASYESGLRLDPGLADAYFNAARLYEQRGDGKQALRHFGAYRRLRG